MTSHRLVGVLLAAAAVATGCGGSSGSDDPAGQPALHNGVGPQQGAAINQVKTGKQAVPSARSGAPAAAAVQSPYCKAAKELARRQQIFYPRASEDPYAVEDRVTFVNANEKLMRSVVRLAPASIEDAVRTEVRALRGGAGLAEAVPRGQARAATARVDDYLGKHC